jgi:hypothetical protein
MMNKSIIPLDLPPPDPSQDSKEHINVHYSFGVTQLGRMLSTYFVARFDHPYFGPFKCVEGFRLYLRTGCLDDAFRSKSGTEAKLYYRKYLNAKMLKNYDVKDEERVLMLAMYERIIQHPATAALFTESTLPFDSYYLWGVDKLPIRASDADMLINSLTTLREHMKAGTKPEPISRDEYKRLRRK